MLTMVNKSLFSAIIHKNDIVIIDLFIKLLYNEDVIELLRLKSYSIYEYSQTENFYS